MMTLSSPKTNTLADALIQRTSSMLDEIPSKPVLQKDKAGEKEEKEVRNKVKPFKNINKNLQNFLKISPMQKEDLPSHKMQDHADQ